MINFETSNQTLRKLLGNGLTYRVPRFQRDYSWTVEEWGDLWLDILAVVEESSEQAHYMGYLVLQSQDNREFDVIDGQQRLTTLSILVLATLDLLEELATKGEDPDENRQRAQALRSSFIGFLDPVSLVARSKLSLNRNNDTFAHELFRAIRRETTSRDHAFELIHSLDDDVDRYLALRDPTPETLSIEDRERDRVLSSLQQLKMFNVRQPLSMLLASYREWPAAGFRRLAQLASVLAFRATVIGPGDSSLEKAFNRVAVGISRGDLTEMAEVAGILEHNYPTDESFRAAFAHKSVDMSSSRNRKIVQYVLHEFEKRAGGPDYDFRSSLNTVEHVLPRAPSAHWPLDSGIRENNAARLGNLTVLEKSLNQDAADLPFEQKKVVYARSGFVMTQSLAREYDSWTAEDIQRRQESMARTATSLWRFDFPD